MPNYTQNILNLNKDLTIIDHLLDIEGIYIDRVQLDVSKETLKNFLPSHIVFASLLRYRDKKGLVGFMTEMDFNKSIKTPRYILDLGYTDQETIYNYLKIANKQFLNINTKNLIINESPKCNSDRKMDISVSKKDSENIKRAMISLLKGGEFETWYTWNTRNWGTKWNPTSSSLSLNGSGRIETDEGHTYFDNYVLNFDTAWNCCDPDIIAIALKKAGYNDDEISNFEYLYNDEGMNDSYKEYDELSEEDIEFYINELGFELEEIKEYGIEKFNYVDIDPVD